jgi:hypothetical protein
MSSHQSKKHDWVEELLAEYQTAKNADFCQPEDILPFGYFLLFERWTFNPTKHVLKWSTFQLTVQAWAVERIGEKNPKLSAFEIKNRMKSPLRKLSGYAKKFTPDFSLLSKANALMKFDYEHLRNCLSHPSEKQKELLALIQLGIYSGRRTETLLNTLWERVEKTGNCFVVNLDVGEKAHEKRLLR